MEPFQVSFLHSVTCTVSSLHSSHGLIAHLSSVLSIIPSSGWATVYLSAHLLKGTLVAPKLWQL